MRALVLSLVITVLSAAIGMAGDLSTPPQATAAAETGE